MTPNTPRPGESWRCLFDPSKPKPRKLGQHGPTCQVVKVQGGMVTFQWLGHYHYIAQQTIKQEQFASEFTRVEAQLTAPFP